MAKRRRFPRFRSGDLPADSQCRELSISGQYPAWSKRRFPGKPTLRTAVSALKSGGGYPAGGRSPATAGRPGAPHPPLRSRPTSSRPSSRLGTNRSRGAISGKTARHDARLRIPNRLPRNRFMSCWHKPRAVFHLDFKLL